MPLLLWQLCHACERAQPMFVLSSCETVHLDARSPVRYSIRPVKTKRTLRN